MYDYDIHLGIKYIGSTLEVLPNYVRLAYVTRNGSQILYHHNMDDGSEGGKPIANILRVFFGFYGVFIE